MIPRPPTSTLFPYTALPISAGESVIMANGNTSDILDRIFTGERVGTLFLPHGGTLSSTKRWLGLTARPRGRLDRKSTRLNSRQRQKSYAVACLKKRRGR